MFAPSITSNRSERTEPKETESILNKQHLVVVPHINQVWIHNITRGISCFGPFFFSTTAANTITQWTACSAIPHFTETEKGYTLTKDGQRRTMVPIPYPTTIAITTIILSLWPASFPYSFPLLSLLSQPSVSHSCSFLNYRRALPCQSPPIHVMSTDGSVFSSHSYPRTLILICFSCSKPTPVTPTATITTLFWPSLS